MNGESQFPDGLLQELQFLRRRVAELERREIERDLPTEGNDLFRRLVEHSLGLMCVHDLEGNLLFVNAAAALTLGFHPEDGSGWNLRRFLSPSVENQFDSYLQRIRDHGVDSGLMRLTAKNGTERIWLYRNVLYEEPGAPPWVLGHAQDVTDRVRAEQALRESEQRFRLLSDTAPVLIWMSDAAARCTFLNQQWLDFTGRGPEDQLGMGWTESIHPEDRGGFALACRSAVTTGAALRGEYRLRRADGEYRVMLTSGVPRTDDEAAFAGLIGICVDVTEARQARAALEQARDELASLVTTETEERRRSHEQLLAEMRHRARIEQELARVRHFESLGGLAGGIAQDLNNLLTVILGRIDLLLDRGSGEFPAHDLSLIRHSAEGAARLAQQLLVFGREQRLEPRPVDLNRLVTELPLAAIAGRDVEVTLRLGEAVRPARIDPDQIDLAIVRLVENARDAMPAGGRLVVETGDVEFDQAFVEHHPTASRGPHVRLAIRNSPGGREETARRRTAEPWSAGEQAGPDRNDPDLAAVYGIIRQQGGHFVVEREPRRSPTFAIYLPVAGEGSGVRPIRPRTREDQGRR